MSFQMVNILCLKVHKTVNYLPLNYKKRKFYCQSSTHNNVNKLICLHLL